MFKRFSKGWIRRYLWLAALGAGAAVSASGAVYYVNDGSTSNDLWCTAVGSDANDGLTPATPKASVQSVIDSYVLTGGDEVRIDTGTYVLSADIVVTMADSGTAALPVTFVGSPYGVTIDRNNSGGSTACFYLNGARFIHITTTNDASLPSVPQRWMRLRGANRGVYVTGYGNRLSRLESTSNGYNGIYLETPNATNNVVENCLLRGNSYGLVSVNNSRTTIRNCTIAGNWTYGVWLYASTQNYLTNNILTAEASGRHALRLELASNVAGADYNLYWATGGATLITSNNATYTSLFGWRAATGQDSRSLSVNPLFVDAAGGDYHLQSTAGSYHDGAFTTDLNDSPGIDTGFGGVGLETTPNDTPLHGSTTGKRNLGAYGGTEQASRTPSQRLVRLYAPLASDQYLNQATPLNIRWTWVGTGWGSGDATLSFDYVNEFGAWVPISGAGAVAVNAGSFSWTISGLLPTPIYQVRATRNIDSTVVTTSGGNFRIGRNIVYYVNDGSTSNDLWAAAVGDDANNGLTPGFPKATVQSVVNTYDLDGGDQVRIDTGEYVLSSDIAVGVGHSGVATARVEFVASPYGVTIDRNNTGGSTACFYLNNAAFVHITTTNDASMPTVPQRWMRLRGANRGVFCTGHGNRISRIEATANGYNGIYFETPAATNNIVENCLLQKNGYGLVASASQRTTIRNCTIADNFNYGVWFYASPLNHLTNNIITANGSGRQLIRYEAGGGLAGADYNLYWASGGAVVGSSNLTTYTTFFDWRSATGFDGRSLFRDPLFVNAAAGNYHLQSTAGSYQDGAFVADANDSPGIDTGFGGVGAETSPNDTPLHGSNTGKRNLGAYGGTEQASRTPAARHLYLYAPLAGEQYLNQATPLNIRWTWVGTDWGSGDATLSFDYVDEFGAWVPVSGASTVAVNDGSFSWTISGLLPTPIYQLRVTRNIDSTVATTSGGNFRIGRKIVYYVNDGSTSNDLWAAAVGNDANNGLTPGFPKATVQSVVNTYDLDGGDQVRIDTGEYVLSSDINVPAEDSGVATARVEFVASPYGVTINRNNPTGTTACFLLNGAQFVHITTTNDASMPSVPQRWARLRNAASGVYSLGQGNWFTRLEATANSFAGIYIASTSATNNLIENCLLRGNNYSGVSLDYVSRVTVRNSTLASNGTYAVALEFSSLTFLTNNILVAHGPGRQLFLLNSSGFGGADYNLYWFTGGAGFGTSNTVYYPTLFAWRTASGQDARSLFRDPLFVNPGSDYHLQSTAGSYQDGVFVADANDSPGIDAGWGGVGLETAPNDTPLHGSNTGKRNLGAYGGTEQASRTPTGRHLYLQNPLAGDQYLNQAVALPIRWNWVGTDWGTGDATLALEYFNEFNTWTNVTGASAVPVNAGGFSWTISSLLPTPIYQLRLIRNVDASIGAQTGPSFRIGRNIVYYVNDSSTSNDLWTTAAGNDTNNGLTPGFPKATVQSVLSVYDLDGGDQVRIDTGDYLLSSDITVSADDGGVATARVEFVASPYGVTIDRNNTGGSTACFFLDTAAFVHITTTNDASMPALPQRWMRLRGANRGIYSTGQGNLFTRLEATANGYNGIYVETPAATNNVAENCLLRGNPYGLVAVNTSRTTVRNCTLADNTTHALWLYASTLNHLTNNIFAVNGAGRQAIRMELTSGLSGSDYNLFWVAGGATLGSSNTASYANLLAWRTATGFDSRSLPVNPLFVNAAAGNYHLQSTAGSYHDGVFVADANDSPGIDTGFGSVGLETAPNSTPLHGANTGKRNLGAYGGTEQASRTPAGRYLYLYAPLGGENYQVGSIFIPIRWAWVGEAWATGNTLQLEYKQSLISFTNVVGGAAVPVNNGLFNWDIAGLPRDPVYELRLTSNDDPSVQVTPASSFSIGGKLTLFVNDNSLSNDQWCVAIGNDANDGALSNRPKATVHSLLAQHDLRPGDEIRIDTGVYNLASNILLTASGSISNPILFVGSALGGGAVLNRGDTNGTTAVIDCQGSGVYFNRLRLTGAARGFVHGSGSRSNYLLNCFIYGNGTGVRAAGTGTLFVVHSTIADNALAGVDSTGATNAPVIVNSILWNQTNDLIAAQAIYSNIKQGDPGPGNLSAPPEFVNPATADYRLLDTSPCMDAGTNWTALLPATDILGQPRVFAGIPDMGAHERPWSVSLTASTNVVAETPASTATLTFSRDGSYYRTVSVPFTITGTASNGVDYQLLSSPVTLSNGMISTALTVEPIADLTFEGTETAVFTLTASGIYSLGATNSATISLSEATDVVVTKSGPSVIGAATAFGYTVVVSNAGPVAALNVVAADPLPPTVTFLSASDGGTLSGTTVVWPAIPALPVGGVSNFTVQVQSPSWGVLTNFANGAALNPDPVPMNNSGSLPEARVITVVDTSADVIVTKTGPVTIPAIDDFTYTIVVSNAGPSAAEGVTVTDTLPAGVTFLIASGGGTNAGGVVNWPPLPTIPASGTITLTVDVTAPGQGVLTNIVSATALTDDPNPANNDGSAPAARAVTTVIPRADVVTTKYGPGTGYAGTTLGYTIVVSNAGPSHAEAVAVTDVLPAGAVFVSASAGGTNDAGTVGWPAISLLPAGEATNLTVSLQMMTPGWITNVAASTAATLDPDSSNNNGSAAAAKVATLVLHSADLVALKSGPTLVLPATNITYTLTITNAGPTVATNVTVTDLLPPDVTFVSASGGGTNAGSVVNWPVLPALAVGAATNFEVVVFGPTVGWVTNRVAVSAAVSDPNPGNNDGSAAFSTVITEIDLTADSDGDGLPDWWEVVYGLDRNDPADAGLDVDGDGFTNFQEYLAGTSPVSSLDALRILDIWADGDDIYIRFTTAVGKSYRVQYRASMQDGSWETLPGVIDGDGTPKEAVDPGGALLDRQYYRVILELGP